ncbi:MAG: bacterial proteasome activator family protein [Myxococcales bacterium]|nr:MAG: bacterial proteasome activator family protein [Myxococcales bacterium]
MTEESGQGPRTIVIGEDGQETPEQEQDPRSLTGLVEEPAKVMRIGSMIRQLLEEVKAAPLDEPGRTRLAQVLHTSVQELKDGLAPELDAELDRLVQPFDESTPTESELRIAQAQLVGWLEGLFHGIQTAIYAQQMAARAQLEQMQRALPAGSMPQMPGAPGQQAADNDAHEPGGQGGMYL